MSNAQWTRLFIRQSWNIDAIFHIYRCSRLIPTQGTLVRHFPLPKASSSQVNLAETHASGHIVHLKSYSSSMASFNIRLTFRNRFLNTLSSGREHNLRLFFVLQFLIILLIWASVSRGFGYQSLFSFLFFFFVPRWTHGAVLEKLVENTIAVKYIVLFSAYRRSLKALCNK